MQLPAVATIVLSAVLSVPLVATAQERAAFVGRDKVAAALGHGGTLLATSAVKVGAVHHDKAGALPVENGTTVLYVTGGHATLVVNDTAQPLSPGDVIVIPAGARRSLKDVTPSIGCYSVTVPVTHD